MIAGICRRYAIVDERGLRDAVELLAKGTAARAYSA